jgi:hemoglobin/transferrin/lactoferrin receptor protein
VSGDFDSDKIDTDGFDLHNTSRFATGAFGHALSVGGDGTLDKVETTDNAGGYVTMLTPSGTRSLYGAYIQDEVSYSTGFACSAPCATTVTTSPVTG